MTSSKEGAENKMRSTTTKNLQVLRPSKLITVPKIQWCLSADAADNQYGARI